MVQNKLSKLQRRCQWVNYDLYLIALITIYKYKKNINKNIYILTMRK